MTPLKISLTAAKKQLKAQVDFPFTTVLQHGTMAVEYYAPKEKDLQTPHSKDELYFIASGTGVFNRNGEYTDCKKGDVLFVPAGMEHRFESFSPDFATWVVFYGEEGGEGNG